MKKEVLRKMIVTIALVGMIGTTGFQSISPVIVQASENQIEEVSPRFINEYRYRKTNVKTSYQWSSYKRVSDNLKTGPEGGSISANKSVSFGTEVSGNISQLGIATNISLSSSKEYTLNVGANKRVYMAYRVKYKVETGTREMYDMVTGRVISSNTYTVKTPQYGEYALLNY
ncbi:hypothetical protein GMB34_00595 [Turicibacter sanguinis]|uniref:hypothetical protein n=1 Tax=Turicibacter sanguinis TaxID=154288 RepID=UPI0006C4F7F9|nr:hypothetical protein [Turicibacter sanguinis]MCU7196514.1 hypothetical protein [Turicibacter sanguinis]MDB8573647.1 hypothetical protein [Turicibacter sanguinis]MDB8577130.1 hypothetical protein [Turicibacter sanguinis]MDB8582439.1 hypothetical protein [Turicibacter sanguinis]MDB8585432.1 hypothetical protein [Turicibacter sanguinis]